MTDEFERRRKGVALAKFQERLQEVCEEQAGILFYAEMVGALVMQAIDIANEEIEVTQDD